MAIGKRFKIEEVKEIFKNGGCELLETKYSNARTPVKYRCSCGDISKICLDSFKRGNRCKKCGGRKNSIKQKGKVYPKKRNMAGIFAHSFDYVKQCFHDRGCVLISENYINQNQDLEYICNCGKVEKRSFALFMAAKGGCLKCGRLLTSGMNNYQWRADRDQLKLENDFRQKCYKMLKYVLKQIGQKKTDRTHRLLGYNHIQLTNAISSHPNWNHVKIDKWHLDHVFPIKAFMDYKINDLKLINSLDNLQPLTGHDNCVKNDKYDKLQFENWLKQKGIKI